MRGRDHYYISYVGNYSTGFIAGRKGISWAEARFVMNLLESYQKMGLAAEGMTTQSAQYLGHQSGISLFRQKTFMYNK
ncbi:hypothetical protein D7322_23150 [Sphingobacterium puteale]|uniref:Uncharacterized protein n=1 Tax=Sphingobacterium puteale TaxID=2420510 RepID=A0A420VS78_9SPHI|nr:hypothetical protein D7322_23150 [Sphingobacterium puteale]